jgi:hypothetical protein
MLWALTNPLLDASTDLGAIDPLIVENKTIFCSALVTSALEENAMSGASVSVRSIATILFI